MGGGHLPPGELSGEYTDDVSSSDGSEIVEIEIPPISSKPFDACVSAYARARSISDAKELILRYKPVDLIEDTDEYEVPDTTTLLLIGPKGSGKTTLFNKTNKLFDSDPLSSNPARLSYNSSELESTFFLQEYMIPKRGKNSICIFDTPGLSNYPEDNFKLLEQWMNKGVRNGDWGLDDKNVNCMEKKSEQKRRVNFVIFVVDAISILKNNGDEQYINLISETFNYPFLSFKDNKPAVVITHGEKLSYEEFNYIQDYIKEILCIPSTQIFSIPGLDEYDSELSILRLLHYCVDKSDKGLQLKKKSLIQGEILQWFVKMMDRLVKYDKIIDIIIVFLCIFVLLLRFLGLFGK